MKAQELLDRVPGDGVRLDARSICRYLWVLVVAAFAVIVAAPAVVGCASGLGPTVLAPRSAPPTDLGAGHAWATHRLRGMTLEEKTGQLFVTYAYGERVDTNNAADVVSNRSVYGVDNAAQLIEKYHLGGIIYFTRFNNVNNPRQIAELSNGIQRVAIGQRQSIPMLISTDQEQGLVARVGPPATQFPGNMALGAGRNPSDAYDAARITGEELRAIGINENLAPVADVNVNALNPVIGVRSFAENTELVSRLTAAQVKGYQDADVAATAKHFPGHGDTTVDSHTGLPVIDHSRQQWERIHMPPFRAAIQRGVDSIMTAHIVVPALDPSGDPATLSEPIITGLLRTKLRYEGVVITDALDMAGVREKYGDDRIPVLALKAGVDQLLMPPNLDLAYHAVLSAVRSGEISERRIDQSVHRILRLKFQRGLVHDPYVDLDAINGVVGTPEHLARAQGVADQTTTLIKDDADVIPMTEGPRSVLVTGWGATTTSVLAERITARGAIASIYETGTSPDQGAVDAAVIKAASSELVVVTTNKAWAEANSGQRRLVEALLRSGTPVIAVAVRDPYDIAYFTDAPTYLATYSYTTPALESLARVLFGEIAPAGRLPVTIPKANNPDTALYEYGHGLTR